jgi:hypothetical protein
MALTRFQDTDQIQKDIETLTRNLEQLRKIYEQYFLGLIREEPLKLRKDVKEVMQKYYGVPIQNASLKFQLQQSVSRYNTYTTYWDRVVRQMEEGTYQRDVFKANLHEKERKEKTGPITPTVTPPKSDDIYENLFNEYKQLKKQLKQDTESLSFSSFREQLKSKVGNLENKGEKFSLKIVQEDKEVKIKLLKKKPTSGE